MRDPRRHLPLSLIAGTLTVVAIYVLINIAYLRTLGLDGLAATTTPAADAANRWMGVYGDRFISAAIAISTFGFLNLAVLAPTRVYYAMAADGTFFPGLAKLHPRFQTPGAAIVMQSVWAIVLAITGEYGDLLGTVVFADWIFFGLTVATVVIFRTRVPIEGRPPGTFRTPGYPIVPIAFSTIAAAVVFSVIYAEPYDAARGAVLLAAGVPVYFWYVGRCKRR
jgi:APA family basic amino acid/polyamine antiporter